MRKRGDRVLEQVRQWRDELISLSRRDRVLYFRPTKSATLLLKDPDPSAVLEGLGQNNGWGFFNPPELEETDPGDDATSTELVELEQLATQEAPTPPPEPRHDEVQARVHG
jgi:hypothetical protein